MTSTPPSHAYKPTLYIPQNTTHSEQLSILKQLPYIKIFDTIIDQLKELIKLRNPHRKLHTDDYEKEITQLLDGQLLDQYGVWVYYEWSHTLVHTLSEAEFIEVRTSRNQYKITKQERDLLNKKKIGIVGLSVGQSIALTMAIERVCGELRLADFDTLELSNLNRIRSGIHNLGIPKVIIAAREIAEIDPYLKVQLFDDGLTEQNIDTFFGTGSNKLDMLVEVCDGLDIKIISRYKARTLGIPVVMDTNDRGMIDIERFDIEPDRPILHGLAGNLNPETIKDLTNEQKIPSILKMVGSETLSTRLKTSIMEVGQTLNTWPQLASSVQLGGAATTDVCRRILLNQLTVSGRFYLDLDELISDESIDVLPQKSTYTNPFTPLEQQQVRDTADLYLSQTPLQTAVLTPTSDEINSIVNAAIAAPSAGNTQPWKWHYRNGRLLLFHDRHRSWSWNDHQEMGALISLGAAIESATLQSSTYKYATQVTYIDPEQYPFMVAEITFTRELSANEHKQDLAKHILNRHTNRKDGTGSPIAPALVSKLSAEFDPKAGVEFRFIEDKMHLSQLGEIIGACERIRLLSAQGHEAFFKDIRWNHKEALDTKDGIELASMYASEAERSAFMVAKDHNAVKNLADWNLGSSFKMLFQKPLNTASGVGIVSIPEFDRIQLLQAGASVLRSWIVANQHNLAVYPILSPLILFNCFIKGKDMGIPKPYFDELKVLHQRFQTCCAINSNPVFMYRITESPQETLKTLRMDKQTIFVT